MEQKKKIKLKQIIPVVVIAVVLIVAFVASAYVLLNQAARKMVVKYTDELAQHDMATIRMFIQDRFDVMMGIHQDLLIRNIQDEDQLTVELSNKSAVKDFDHIMLMDENGTLYADMYTVYEGDENPFTKFFNAPHENPFARRYADDINLFADDQNEYMMYGYDFPDDEYLVLGEGETAVKFTKMIVVNDISKIRNRLRITCFDGHGYASIINNNGDYVVPDDETMALGTYQNFYDILKERDLEGITAEQVEQNVLENKDSSFWCETKDEVRRFVSVYTLENSNWNFVIALDESVFSDQINSFIQMLTSVFAIFFAGMLIIIFLSFRTRLRLRNMYASVAKGVYNRQYYEERLINAHATALAIMDLDHLKVINDTYGHVAGDLAIKKLATVISEYVSGMGIVCRFGGDEFVAVFTTNFSETVFEETLANIRQKVSEAVFNEFPKLKISTSVGGYYGEGNTKDLLPQADELLYKAKIERNAVVTNTKSDPDYSMSVE